MPDAYIAYIQRVIRYDVLPEHKIKSLIRRAQEGDRRAFDRAVLANLKLVVGIARDYHRQVPTSPLLDLIQQGNLGLMEAVRKFDLARDIKFSTYAHFHIRAKITRYLDDTMTIVRVPVYLQYAWKRAKRKEERGEDLTERDRKFLRYGRTYSFSLNGRTEEGSELEDFLVSTEPPKSFFCDFCKLVNTLDDKRMRDIVFTKITKGTTLRELGARYNLSRERIRQLYAQGLKIIKFRARRDLDFIRK